MEHCLPALVMPLHRLAMSLRLGAEEVTVKHEIAQGHASKVSSQIIPLGRICLLPLHCRSCGAKFTVVLVEKPHVVGFVGVCVLPLGAPPHNLLIVDH